MEKKKSVRGILNSLVWEALKEGQRKNYLQIKDWEYGVDQALAEIEGMVVPSVEEMSEVTVDLVEENFPKGECKERGKAIVLHAQMLIAFHAMLKERVK